MTFAGLPVWAVAALAAGSAGLLAVLHLLRVRPREVRVVTTLFWASAVERTRARTLLERFRHPWTYALLLLICAFLVLALGQPQRTSEPPDRVWEVIVVDGGASMKASFNKEGLSYAEAARSAARDAAGRLSTNDRLAVIVANPWPSVIHRFDEPFALVDTHLAAAETAEVPAETAQAVALARSLLHGRSHPRIVLITNSPNKTEAAPAPNEPPVQLVCVGTPVDNAAILSMLFEPAGDNPLRGRLSVRVGYWGDGRSRDAGIEVQRAGGAPLLNESRTIEPGATQDFVVADLPADGDTLTVRLKPDDAVMADNQATVRLPLRTPIRIGITGAVPAALRLALESDPAIRLVNDQPRDIDVLVGTPRQEVARRSIIVVDTGPAAPASRPSVAAGQPVRAAIDSPLARDLDWEGATCGTGSSVGALGDGAAALVVTGNAATQPSTAVLAAMLAGPAHPRLCLGSALSADDATACRRPAYAILVSRATRRLAGWDDDPIVLTPERSVEDPLWCKRAGVSGNVVVMPTSREAGAVGAKASAPLASEKVAELRRRGALPQPFEILLFAAMACFLLEAVLHARGRIS